MPTQCNLKLVFETKKFDLSAIDLYSNEQQLEFNSLMEDSKLTLETKIKLPTNLYIMSRSKNLTLTEFWLGNVRASPEMLAQICLVTFKNNKTLFTNSLILPGVMKIEIYSKSFIEFHLLNKNLFSYA